MIESLHVRLAFIEVLPTLLSISCGKYSPSEEMMDFMKMTVHETMELKEWENYDTANSRNNDKHLVVAAPTKSAGMALQVTSFFFYS
jgi:hypothetical protein